MSFGQAVLAYLVSPVLTLLVIVIFINVILSWLVNFNVVNPHNEVVRTIWRATSALAEPVLRPVRSVLPPLGGIDLSPLVVLLLIFFIRDYLVGQVLWRALAPAAPLG